MECLVVYWFIDLWFQWMCSTSFMMGATINLSFGPTSRQPSSPSTSPPFSSGAPGNACVERGEGKGGSQGEGDILE